MSRRTRIEDNARSILGGEFMGSNPKRPKRSWSDDWWWLVLVATVLVSTPLWMIAGSLSVSRSQPAPQVTVMCPDGKVFRVPAPGSVAC